MILIKAFRFREHRKQHKYLKMDREKGGWKQWESLYLYEGRSQRIVHIIQLKPRGERKREDYHGRRTTGKIRNVPYMHKGNKMWEMPNLWLGWLRSQPKLCESRSLEDLHIKECTAHFRVFQFAWVSRLPSTSPIYDFVWPMRVFSFSTWFQYKMHGERKSHPLLSYYLKVAYAMGDMPVPMYTRWEEIYSATTFATYYDM